MQTMIHKLEVQCHVLQIRVTAHSTYLLMMMMGGTLKVGTR